MTLPARLLSLLLLFSLIFSPLVAAAQISSFPLTPSAASATGTISFPLTPAAASTINSKSANTTNNIGILLGLGILGVLGLGFLFAGGTTAVAPTVAASAGRVSFGGKILTINYCVNGDIAIKILPAGTFPPNYIWTPATKTGLYGPPMAPGQEVLGLALPGIIFCLGPGDDPTAYFGLPMLTVGTSLFVGGAI